MINSTDVLLVEDNIYDAELAILALQKRNLASGIQHVTDGAQALDFMFYRGKFEKRKRQQPKIILLDLKMPKVSGFEVLKELKSNETTKAIPIVILTSSALDPDIEKCYKLGANSYIVKPVGFDNFTQTVIDLGMYWVLVNK